MHSISFFDNNVKSNLKQKTLLKAFIHQSILKATKRNPSLTYIFTDDSFLHTMNMDYLQHDTYTDIITFDLSNDAINMIGEIYISVDRVKENAILYKCAYHDELLRVIFHGALHLCGYKDKSSKDKALMRTMEENWLKNYKSTL